MSRVFHRSLFFSLVAAFGALAPLGAASTQDRASLITLGPHAAEFARTLEEQLESLSLLGYRVETVNGALEPGRAAIPGLQTQGPAKDLGWAFVVQKGSQTTLIASGRTPPGSAALETAFRQAGLVSPIQELRAFVRAHPAQMEARVLLCDALRKTATERTRRCLRARKPAKDAPSSGFLEEADDLAIWGPFAQTFEELFSSGAWQCLDLDLALAEDPAEGHSHVVRFFIQRHIRKVDDALRKNPRAENLWRLRLWMGKAADVKGVAALLETCAPGPGGTYVYHPAAAGDACIEELRTQQRWSDLRHYLMEWVWPDWVCSQGGTWFQRGETKTEQALWTSRIEPLVEACQHLGDASTLSEVVSFLFSHPKLEGMAGRLRRRLSAGDPLHALAAPRLDAVALEDYMGTCLLKTLSDPAGTLFLVGTTPVSDAASELAYTEIKSTMAYTDVNDPGIAFLYRRERWDRKRPRWILLDGQGRIVATREGECRLSEFNAAHKAAGLPRAIDRDRAFLERNPDRLDVAQVLVADLFTIATLKTQQTLGGPLSGRTTPLDAETDLDIWGEPARCLGNLLDKLDHAQGLEEGWWVPSDPAVFSLSPTLQAVLAKFRPTLETSLEQMPSNRGYWTLWLLCHAMAPETGSVQDLMDRLAPSPGTTCADWPPMAPFRSAANQLLKDGKPGLAVALLKPLADRIIQGGVTTEATWLSHAQPLLKACLASGDDQGAEELLKAWAAHDGWKGAWKAAATVAREQGANDLASRWMGETSVGPGHS